MPKEALGARVKGVVKAGLPPLLTSWVGRLVSPTIRFAGPYPSWDAASARSSGYSAKAVLETAARQTLEQRAQAWLGGGELFQGRLRHSWPVLAGLLRAAVEAAGRLSVLDFGGGLGALHFVLRPFLGGVQRLRWSVVEQPHFVARGREQFEDDVLRFHGSPEECLAAESPNVLVLAGVLQYLPDPGAQLDRLLALRIPHVIVDRAMLLEGNDDVLAVQELPRSLGGTSYPCWFFGGERFATRFAGYQLVAAFDSSLDSPASVGGRRSSSKGFLFRALREAP
jgi:putative methyltransferase (TIGR04325 family)